MRKMKKINGFLVVRFNDREKRDNPTLGSFGVIDAEQYTGDLDFDLDAFEYTDADLIEIAVEQARGLDAEEDFSEEAPTYTVAVESAEGFSEEEVYPKAMALSWAERLKTHIKSKSFPYIDPRTAAHELIGYKTALYDLGLLDEDDKVTELDIFGAACETVTDDGHRVEVMLPSKAGLAILSPHDFEEGETFTNCTVQTLRCRRCGMESFAWSKEPSPEQEEALSYVCDEVCRFREGRTQEELDAICEKCKLESWARARMQKQEEAPYYPEEQGAGPYHAAALGTASPGEPKLRTGFDNLPENIGYSLQTKRIYALGLVLADECPANDCRVFLNIFNMARELDAALDKIEGYPAEVMRRELNKHFRELGRMYYENRAVQMFKEGMQP